MPHIYQRHANSLGCLSEHADFFAWPDLGNPGMPPPQLTPESSGTAFSRTLQRSTRDEVHDIYEPSCMSVRFINMHVAAHPEHGDGGI